MSRECRPDDEKLRPLAEMCAALGSPVRLKILRQVMESTCTCGEVVQGFDRSQSTISHHLKVLKDAGLVIAREDGACVCYVGNRPALDLLKRMIDSLKDG